MSDTLKLFGMPGSLYTGKVRSYLIKQGIEFEEHAAGSARFRDYIVGEVGRWIIPVVELPDGTILQDGADIIDHLEAEGSRRFQSIPQDPVLRTIAYLFELYGGEGLLRPAMHYRWNFDEQNLAFIKDDFIAALAPSDDPAVGEQIFMMASQRMRSAMGFFGVSSETIPTVEKAYTEFLELFNEHLKHSPYLLGGTPTIGDYGLIAPLYAHLARDPAPSMLMKQVAPRVWRWVERMNSRNDRAPEYDGFDRGLFAPDALPETLMELMSFVAADYLPEIEAHVDFANAWLDKHPGIEEGTLGLKQPGDRIIGKAEFDWRGHTVETTVMPYRFFMLQRVQDSFECAGDKNADIEDLFSRTGLHSLLNTHVKRRVERQNHLEYWGADQ